MSRRLQNVTGGSPSLQVYRDELSVLSGLCRQRDPYSITENMAGSRVQDEEMADAPAERPARLRSTVTAVRKQKGRGFREDMDVDDDRRGVQTYESLDSSSRSKGGQKCKPVNSLHRPRVKNLALATRHQM